MDGGARIYQNIAPMWDGEDDRFNVDKLTEAELNDKTGAQSPSSTK